MFAFKIIAFPLLQGYNVSSQVNVLRSRPKISCITSRKTLQRNFPKSNEQK